MSLDRVMVIGAGAWGTALAQAAALAGRSVTLVGRDADLMAAFNQTRLNRPYLGDLPLSDAIFATIETDALEAADIVIMGVPAQATRQALAALGPERLAGKPVVLSAKGLEKDTLKRQSQILAELAPQARPLVLSGPSFAHDVAAGRPTAVTLAGPDAALAGQVAQALAGPSFRPYAAGDMTGVELAGGLKNVYALGCGAVEGAQLGLSARASLLARAYVELSRLVEAMGGAPSTLTGLAGLGDLTLSCTSTQSRNYRFGVELGVGRPVADIALGIGLAEGVHTAPVAQSLARQTGIDVPLIDAVNLLLAGSLAINDIVAGLMARPLKRED